MGQDFDLEIPLRQTADRMGAIRLPFLLHGELARKQWADRGAWDLRTVPEPDAGRVRPELLARAALQERILVTRDPQFLDDKLFPPVTCAGLIVVGDGWDRRLDEFLVMIVGLVGPIRALYHGVKVHGGPSLTVTITAPAGRARRVTRRFLPDRSGTPTLSELQSTDGRIYGFPGYRRSAARARVLAS